ncbi:hypothetical protein [Fig virus B]|uniref:p22 n=1 Tax=Fig closterovirus 1 TaxID=2809010 RepID=A0A8A0Y1I3_9CLOS|nr:hypothetical protein [Fig virus B]QSQ86317.1 p22 [Fig closterovirus 1]
MDRNFLRRPLLLRNIVVQRLTRSIISFYFFDINNDIYLVHNRNDQHRDIPLCFEKIAILFFDGSYLDVSGSIFRKIYNDIVDVKMLNTLSNNINSNTLRILLSDMLVIVPLRYITLTPETKESIRKVVLGTGYLYIPVLGSSNNLTLNIHTNRFWPSRYCSSVTILENEIRDVVKDGYVIDHISLCDTS